VRQTTFQEGVTGMTIHVIPADEQLTVHYGDGCWRLHGPDDKPVFEVRSRAIYYHPLFGRWRDLPPGNRMSTDGLEGVQVRWDGGWAVGLTFAPNRMWRRLVRWTDTRQISQADEAGRALSDLLGIPLQAEDDALPAVMRVGGSRQTEPELPFAPVEPPAFAPPKPVVMPHTAPPESAPDPTMPAPVYTVRDATDVRLPLRLGGGALLVRDEQDRLVLTVPTQTRTASWLTTVLGLVTVGVFVAVLWILSSGSLGENPQLGLAVIGGLLIIVGLIGVLVLARLNRGAVRRVVFDRTESEVVITPGEDDDARTVLPFSALHGVRLHGKAVKQRTVLAYQRQVSLILGNRDLQIITETRPTTLPPDPATMPSLAALRRQADEQAGPSLARAGARVIAWYLGLPLADE
jgi:hypothetical protein